MNPFHILIIDDHPTQVTAYQDIIELVEDELDLHFHTFDNLKDGYEFIVDDVDDKVIDLALLDLNMPAFEAYDLYSGVDLAKVIQANFPQTQLCFITSHHEALLLYDLYHDFDPAGILIKSDFDGQKLEGHFQDILKGQKTYSPTFLEAREKIKASDLFLESYNRDILKKLAEGYPSKDLPDLIGLSMSAIDKRKARLKIFFNTDGQADNYLIIQARKEGFI